MSSLQSLAIAQICPHPMTGSDALTENVRRVSEELAARGHRVLIIAPSSDAIELRRSSSELATGGDQVLPAAGEPPKLLAIGEAITGIKSSALPAIPLDSARHLSEALALLPLDLIHVHEPYGPVLSAVALRHSEALNVASFYSAQNRSAVAVPGTRKRSSRLLGRIDLRFAASESAAALASARIGDHHTCDVSVPPPAWLQDAKTAPTAITAADAKTRSKQIVVCADEERTARRIALRALRQIDDLDNWTATICTPNAQIPPSLRPELRERISFVEGEDAWREACSQADIAVFASVGAKPAPSALVEALHLGAVPVASNIDVYRELLSDDRGVLFDGLKAQGLAHALRGLIADDDGLNKMREAAADWARQNNWTSYLDQLEAGYERLLARRHDPNRFDPELLVRLAERKLIDVDLHMHTDHSGDCATPVPVLLDTARAAGLGAIAITDHNEVSGAFAAAEIAAEYGVKVIIGEEVKTADQGEVIGLFLNEKIPKGVSLQEAIAEIKRQGGIVYVPHPFDRMHSVPDYEHLLDVLDDVDAIEIFNPRVAIGSFNEEAVKFASKYRIVAGAGSDSHVAQGLGTVRLRMRDFDGPEEFLASLSQAEIHTKSGSLVYVQALKFLETKATPPGARELVARRRVRKASAS